MPRKSYITQMPDKTGAFLVASRIIAKHKGNIVRVSYNKAVDLHTLFIDVKATAENLDLITKELEAVGYLNDKISEINVIMIEIKIPDAPGSVLPVLKILDNYDINISYLNSSENDSSYQNFKMGLLIENPSLIKMLLDDISEIYQVNVIDYANSEKNLDNTIFYIRLANEMQKLLGLSAEKTMEFISESNRILQMLQEKGENPVKVFDYIRRFAYFICEHKGANFKTDIEKIRLNPEVTLYSIEPPCGSNTYVLETIDELVLIDTGYAIYAEEMFAIFSRLFSGWEKRITRIYITHADVDHCGLLSKVSRARIYLNQKSADSLQRQRKGVPDYREKNDFGLGYSKLSRIISGYTPPDSRQFEIVDQDLNIPLEHNNLVHIGDFVVSNLKFEIFEGSGGHLYGEMIFVCREHRIIFTGDNLVNIHGFSSERAEFNSLAPFLMRSVNVDSEKATQMRNLILKLIQEIEVNDHQSCIICGGHGPVSTMIGGKIVKFDGMEKFMDDKSGFPIESLKSLYSK
ncbi:MAG TPA: MBL fold hydrolase [Firmicutes bacterium]|nr:MBL fold hydrolase [Bacillota bacterium]